MEEPSVLDYVKSKLKFWERGGKIVIPDEPELLAVAEEIKRPQPVVAAPPVPVEESPEEESPAEEPTEQPQPVSPRGWPWRTLLAILFVFIGQRSFEPSLTRSAGIGLFLYGAGLVFLVLAYLRKEWTPAELPDSGAGSDPLTVRLVPFILSMVLMVAAFLTFGGNLSPWLSGSWVSLVFPDNLFTPLNVSLWVLCIVYFLRAFWVKHSEPSVSWWQQTFGSPERRKQALRWGLVLLAVTGLVVFFRVYRINTVPSEPFSDHAEKILDVYDVTQGETHIFFPRNTGREAIQMYLTVAVAWLFGTGLSFLSLKIGTVLCGLATLPYLYLLGKEIGGKRVALLAVLFAGIAYWPNVISRVGLRFPLYPLFVAPVLYYLIRGLRTRERNDFILSGLFLGLGLHGYSPIRILPFVVVAAFVLYILHKQSRGARKQAVIWLALLALTSLVIFLPLARYWMDNPDAFGYRAFSRLGSAETPLTNPAWKIFLSNFWNGIKMFNWDDGEIWVHSVPHRPALDIVSGGLFVIGFVWVLVRYIKRRHWLDLFLLVSIPLLQLPSTLSLAFPAENPALNRAGGALVPTFLLVAVALDGLVTGLRSRLNRRAGTVVTSVLVAVLLGVSVFQNYDLVFNQYAIQFENGAWNSSEMGQVIKQFQSDYGTTDSVWIVPYPYWVDTRLPGVWAGIPNRDFAIWPEDLAQTLTVPAPKLFMLKPEDETSLAALQTLYPQGQVSLYESSVVGHNFLIFFVPSEQ